MSNSDSPPPIKVLFLEDSEQDVEFVIFELEIAGIAAIPKQVVTKKDFLDALETFEPEVILADYSLPMFVYYGDVDHPVPGQIDHWVS